MGCEQIILGICFETPSGGLQSSIFGFAEFISALALLVIVFTIAGVRYRFRVAIAPLPLKKLTYALIGVIGFGTLLTDIWLAQKWLVPKSFISQPLWQGMFGAFFLSLAMTWIYYAFINPTVFCEKNPERFAHELFKIILKGSDTEMPVIADELLKSADPLVKLALQDPPRHSDKDNEKKERTKRAYITGEYAYDVLLLIGNRKLIRHIIASSSGTAIAFFNAITDNGKYRVPIGQFAKNISAEAIINKDSILYHEDEGYSSGLIGYIKPFSKTIYGNYRLVEALGSNMGSPLDIPYEIIRSWDSSQLKAYARAVIITLNSYFESGIWNQPSYALNRAISNIKNSCFEVYKLNDIPSDYYSSDIFKRLEVVVDFAKDATNLMNKQPNLPPTKLRVRKHPKRTDFYDHIADLIFEIIQSVASVKEPPEKCWFLHHNLVWSPFFTRFTHGKAWRIIQFKLRRLLYNEIIELEKFPNYQSSKILGYCLNVMGLNAGKKDGYGTNYYPLHKAVLVWTRNNYLRLRSVQPDVEESCLIGSIGFDEENSRLVKTYFKGLNLEAPREYLELNNN